MSEELQESAESLVEESRSENGSPARISNEDRIVNTRCESSPPSKWSRRSISSNPRDIWRKAYNTWIMEESVMLLKLAIPLFVMSVFFQLPFFITLLFVGHFSSKVQLDATLLGNTFLNITGVSVIIGMALAADTLCPQSYGYKNYKRVGVILQRGLLILSVTCVPIAVIWLNSESLLLLVKQDPCVVNITGKYAGVFLLSLPGFLVYTMLTKYLQAQSMVVIFIGIGFISNVCLVLFCSLFVIVLHLDAIGASLSLVLASSLNPIMLLAYIKWRKLYVQTWGGWSFECLTEWWQFVRLGLPGVLTLMFEWWSFEISTLVAGAISTTQLTISSTILQLGTIYYMAPLGMAQAVTVRVGNELGAGNIRSAKRASYVALILQTIFATVLSIATLASRNYIGLVFISDAEVVAGVGDTMTTAIGIIFLDQIQGVISGVMRATGRQAILAIINFCCYYIVGLPLGISLALAADMKAKGIWLGLSVADLIQTITLLILLLRTNWKKESEKAIKNARTEAAYASNFTTKSRSSSLETQDSGIDKEEVDNDMTSTGNADESDPSTTSIDSKQTDKLSGVVTAHVVKFASNFKKKDLWLHQSQYKKPNDVEMEEIQRMPSEEDWDQDDRRESGVDVSCDDTSHLITQDDNDEESSIRGRSNSFNSDDDTITTGTKLYKSSTRFCQTKATVVLGKVAVLLVCILLLAGGAILAATIQHHPEGCDLEEARNCSSVCFNSSVDVNLLISTDQAITTPSPSEIIISPAPSSAYNDYMASSDCLCEFMPTPSMTFG